MGDKFVSIVIPCFNEQDNVNRTLDQLLELAAKHPYKFEFVVINDGSLDNTWDVVKEYAQKYSEVIGVNQAANFGQSASYQAGFDIAKGDYILTLSADLEIPIENVNQVIEYLDEGYDFVNTNRTARWANNKGMRNLKSGLANRLITRISGVKVQDRGSGLKGYRQAFAKKLRLYGDMHRFIPDYLSVYGARMIEFDVAYIDRDYGESAYKSQNRTLRVILDLLTLSFMLYFAKKPFWMMPGRVFGFSGLIMTGIGFGLGAYLVFIKLVLGQDIGNRPLLTLAVLLMVIGFQSIMFGLLGELMVRIYFESSGRTTYTVREIVE